MKERSWKKHVGGGGTCNQHVIYEECKRVGRDGVSIFILMYQSLCMASVLPRQFLGKGYILGGFPFAFPVMFVRALSF